jgi:hypothetical protein
LALSDDRPPNPEADAGAAISRGGSGSPVALRLRRWLRRGRLRRRHGERWRRKGSNRKREGKGQAGGTCGNFNRRGIYASGPLRNHLLVLWFRQES